jgi:hypothetical protein
MRRRSISQRLLPRAWRSWIGRDIAWISAEELLVVMARHVIRWQ